MNRSFTGSYHGQQPVQSQQNFVRSQPNTSPQNGPCFTCTCYMHHQMNHVAPYGGHPMGAARAPHTRAVAPFHGNRTAPMVQQPQPGIHRHSLQMFNRALPVVAATNLASSGSSVSPKQGLKPVITAGPSTRSHVIPYSGLKSQQPAHGNSQNVNHSVAPMHYPQPVRMITHGAPRQYPFFDTDGQSVTSYRTTTHALVLLVPTLVAC
jgi:hypothetical protein